MKKGCLFGILKRKEKTFWVKTSERWKKDQKYESN